MEEKPQGTPVQSDQGPPPGPEPGATPFEGDETPAQSATAAPPVKPKDETADLRKRLEGLEAQNKELIASERYWADKARADSAGAGEEGDEDEAPPAEPLTEEKPEEFIERLTTQGASAIEAELRKRGFIRKEDVEPLARKVAREIVNAERGKLTSDAKLVRDFPELQDQNSPLFQATAQIYHQAIQDDPNMMNSPTTLQMAARVAKAELAAKNKGGKPQGESEPSDYRDDRESERRRRVSAQQGERGVSGTPFEDQEEPLGPEAQRIIRSFGRFGVTEENYRRRRARDRRTG
jgi:hypothetical protein